MSRILRYRPLDIYPDPLEARIAELHEMATDVHARQARRWRRQNDADGAAGGPEHRFPCGNPQTRH
ncbi:hypothetical protein [Cupriavidus oxalaticus]|jgi:hypothetical protein|uniref:Uncharacterized protein n=1 Tax=Cupriavidus oxalaticus TaxID=96344 RepID=A0A375GH45_9BURK|nr:hypothetical protein [Cupriavidus oxalaticus]QEZ44843.1 hypothetical protein D2917_11800 [Cupriavidus oxalaticus]QRQ83780.1 hypothetical protein JTE91_08120 [Cupriavidus oxalaticus]QRQ92131.1 hypothetical protein JTE92_04225 [Cupriavidus oxalaticus]WQD86730.1 hypothetical protein U0036_22330 [Cupriavidus oxalaticus]SPC19217.1 conserved hypothetical protein [Cupriavidus oxalaticus]